MCGNRTLANKGTRRRDDHYSPHLTSTTSAFLLFIFLIKDLGNIPRDDLDVWPAKLILVVGSPCGLVSLSRWYDSKTWERASRTRIAERSAEGAHHWLPDQPDWYPVKHPSKHYLTTP